MDLETVYQQVRARLAPLDDPEPGRWVLLVLAVALLAIVLPPVWRRARAAVTIVHELGHAAVGVLVGRRFTGFVVSGDMSGQAVTVGKPRGAGRVLSAGAGYPAPAVLGAVLVQLGLSPWTPIALCVAFLVLLLALVFARSVHTVVALLVAAAVIGLVWWFGAGAAGAGLTLGIGVFLLLGAWRHLGAVVGGGRRIDDPQQLAALTSVPAGLWNLSFALVLGACTWWAGTALLPHVL